ncbi:MAG: UDP-3-O-(3-hydroxymyristoyl)glucosamine N-acyltransferase [Pseudomonadota bacterium]
MAYSIAEIAAALGTVGEGDTSLLIDAVREPSDAAASDLALAMKPDYAEALTEGQARAALVWHGADWQAMGLSAAIVAPRPRAAMPGLTQLFDPGPGYPSGVHPSAVVDQGAILAEDVSVGPLAVIGAGARIGARSVIGPQSYVGTEAVLGEDCVLREGVRICARVIIGDRFIGHPNAVIGGDGFSFVTPETSGIEKVRQTLGDQGEALDQSYMRIHSLGSVQLGHDVEVGALSAIDRGTIRDTVIGDGTKIDNLVQIGHNCTIGRDCMICSMCGLSGSVRVGNNVVMAGKTGVSDNVFIGDNVITGGASKVFTNIPAGRVVLGHPAMKMETTLEVFKGLRRLKRLFSDVDALKKQVAQQSPRSDK